MDISDREIERGRRAFSSACRNATADLPVCQAGAFSGPLSVPDDLPADSTGSGFSSAALNALEPRSVKTDTTKCLIRALRARVDPPLASAADSKSLNPRIRALQETQKSQHDRLKVHGEQIQRRRHGTSSATGKMTAKVHKLGTGPDVVAKRTRPSDRMLFGGLGVSSNAMVQGLTVGAWDASSRECRQACIRTSLSTALRHSPSPALSEMYRIWEEDPTQKQSVTSAVRRELADTVPRWSMSELQIYLTSANISCRRASSSRRELQALVINHLRPPARQSRAVTDASR